MSAQPSAPAAGEASPHKAPSPSGRLLLRMPSALHAELARAAERDGASLNGYITSRLSESVGWVTPELRREASQSDTRQRTLVWLLVANAVAVGLASLVALAILAFAVAN